MAFPIVEDTYRFACTRCGECCFDQSVALEPRDVFELGSHEHVVFERDESGVWQARIGFVRWPGKGKKCPYLQHDGTRFGCSLHAEGKKPFVCTFSPLARKRGEDIFYLVPPVDGCPGMGRGSPLPVVESERLGWSRWYQDTIAPRIEHSEALMRRAFLTKVASVTELNQHLELF